MAIWFFVSCKLVYVKPIIRKKLFGVRTQFENSAHHRNAVESAKKIRFLENFVLRAIQNC